MLNQQLHVSGKAHGEIATLRPEEQLGVRSWADHAIAAEAWERQNEAEWARVDQKLRDIAARRAALDAEEANLLRYAEELKLWRGYGFGSLLEYMERVMGYAPHTATERLRVARAIAELPLLAEALERGELAHSAVRELSRVAVPDTEDAWLGAARGKSLREIEALVSGHRPGHLPTDETEPRLHRKTLTLEVSPETYDIWRKMHALAAEEHGQRLSDDELISSVFRRAYGDGSGGSSDGKGAGTPAYKLAIKQCPDCKRAWQYSGGRDIEIDPAVAECAACDAVHLGSLDAASPQRTTTTVTPRKREQVLARDGHCCAVPGCRRNVGLDLHHIEYQSRGGSHDLSNLTTLCDLHHRALHFGKLVIRGAAPDRMTFEFHKPRDRRNVTDDDAPTPPSPRISLSAPHSPALPQASSSPASPTWAHDLPPPGAVAPPTPGAIAPPARGAITPPARGAINPPARGAITPPVRGDAAPPTSARGPRVAAASTPAGPTWAHDLPPPGTIAPPPPGTIAPPAPSTIAPQALGAIAPPTRDGAEPPTSAHGLRVAAASILAGPTWAHDLPALGAIAPQALGAIAPPTRDGAEPLTSEHGLRMAAASILAGPTWAHDLPPPGAVAPPALGAIAPPTRNGAEPLTSKHDPRVAAASTPITPTWAHDLPPPDAIAPPASGAIAPQARDGAEPLTSKHDPRVAAASTLAGPTWAHDLPPPDAIAPPASGAIAPQARDGAEPPTSAHGLRVAAVSTLAGPTWAHDLPPPDAIAPPASGAIAPQARDGAEPPTSAHGLRVAAASTLAGPTWAHDLPPPGAVAPPALGAIAPPTRDGAEPLTSAHSLRVAAASTPITPTWVHDLPPPDAIAPPAPGAGAPPALQQPRSDVAPPALDSTDEPRSPALQPPDHGDAEPSESLPQASRARPS